jgi:RNA polymerase sigma-70 factor, ECF subfamily
VVHTIPFTLPHLLAGWLNACGEVLGLWLAAAVADEVPASAEPETAWMRRVAAGDEAAFDRLFERWKRPLLGYFYRSLQSHADAEDLTLEVFVRLHRAAPRYRADARFSTYLFQIARNILRNELRRRRRKPADTAPPEVLEAWPDDDASARPLAELEENLHRALATLPEKPRTALLLIHQQNHSYAEAAAILRTNENALRVLVHRARLLLKTAWQQLPS